MIIILYLQIEYISCLQRALIFMTSVLYKLHTYLFTYLMAANLYLGVIYYIRYVHVYYGVNLIAKKLKRDKHGMCVKRTKSSAKLKAGL